MALVESRLTLKKLHPVLEFNQSRWLKPCEQQKGLHEKEIKSKLHIKKKNFAIIYNTSEQSYINT